MRNLIGVEPFDAEILRKAEKLRQQISVPVELDSPFFLARFLRGNRGDEELTAKRLMDYFTHRRLLGYDKLDDMQVLRKHPITKATFERFSISKMEPSLRSNNCHVLIQKMEGSDVKEIIKVIPLSYVLHSYFALQEMFCRCIAKTENETGRPSAVVCVLDLKGLALADFANPLGGPAKLARLVVKIWSDYFSENMIKLVLINPPGLVSLLFKITRLLMDEATVQRLSILQSLDDLHALLEPQVIPLVYGGQWVDRSGFADPPETCVNQLLPVLQSEHRKAEEIWAEEGYISPPQSKTFTVKGRHKHDVHKKCTREGERLIWQFDASADIDFEILRLEPKSENEKNVWPRLTLTSLKVAEFGALECGEAGDYVLRFSNPSATWFPVKITLLAEIK
ncbi:unnamed protein product, partial [Mesorhabditis belari]|uniref:CRAL-TRIO domain-containing protein n=1 Tax=Mesorhabditis belari TaxID=2138241 RepID=A0AAF3FKL6_9BILA